MSNDASLQLAAHGLSSKDLAVLRSLLSLYRDRLSRECELCCDARQADLHLVDVDGPAGQASWEALGGRSQRIAFSQTAIETPLLLGKPLRGPALLAVLNEAILQPKGDGAETARHRRLPVACDNRLLIELLEAGDIDRAVRITTPDPDDDLWIDPELRQYLLGSMLSRLRDFLRSPLQVGQMQYVSRQEFSRQAQLVRPQTLTRLRWSSALACSDGDLLATFDRSVPIRLTSWPDMEGHSPSFFRMAGLLLKQAVTFDVITDMTGVDSGTAADFVNASYRSGLIRQERIQTAGAGFASTGRHFVAMLRQRLGLS